MAGQSSAGDAPAISDAALAPEKKTAEEIASEEAAAEAKAKLRLFKVTASRKLRVPPPVLELHEGANHFELGAVEDSKPLLDRLAQLVKTGDVTVEIIDGDGKATPWPPTDQTAKS